MLRSLRLAGPLAVALLAAPGWTEEEEPDPVVPADLPRSLEVEKADFEKLELERTKVQFREGRLDRRVERYLTRAGELAEKDQNAEAERLLQKILESRLTSYEQAYVYRLLGFIAYGDQRSEEAISYFRKSISQQALAVKDENQMRYGIGQLYIGQGEWVKAIRAFKEWLRYAQDPDPSGYFVQAIAYYQLKEFDAAIAHNQKALELSSKPQEGWLRLLAALHAERQDFAKAAPVLEELLLRFPSKQYWVQLALIHAARESYDVSLAVQQMAYAQGFLTEDRELLRLAQGYVYHSLPYPAAQMLEHELETGGLEKTPEHYEMLANSWIAAREYNEALVPLRQAAQLADSGTFYVRLGQVHMQREEWSEAAEYLRRALEKGDLDDKRGSAQVLLGISLYNAGNLEGARSTFDQARAFEKNRAEAERWIEHISKELGQA